MMWLYLFLLVFGSMSAGAVVTHLLWRAHHRAVRAKHDRHWKELGDRYDELSKVHDRRYRQMREYLGMPRET